MSRIRNVVSVIILSSIVVLLIAILIQLDRTRIKSDHDYIMVPPVGYAPIIADEMMSREDFISADSDERMNILYDYLLYLSANGYEAESPYGEKYYRLILHPEDIILDWDNHVISITEYYEDKEMDGIRYGIDVTTGMVIDYERSAIIQEPLSTTENHS